MPYYSIRTVKALIRADQVDIRSNALQSAYNDFGWGPAEIKACKLKLNDRPRIADLARNHFHKTERHWRIPNTLMDYYKAENIMQGFSVYTHFYIHPQTGRLVIGSFKER